VVATVPEMSDADAYDEFEPLDNAGEDEVEPLEIVPYPVPIEAHDPEVGGGSVVRLFFQPGDRDAAPDVDLADVVILETWDRVSIGLVRRGVTGEGPDGVNYGESLARRANVSLDVALAEPLGTRPLVDAWTGEVVRRVERRSDAPLHTETVGTPLWRQF
jgi:hypothetical protein